MSRYVKSLVIRADAITIYQACADHFVNLGYSIKKASKYSYLEFKREGTIFTIHEIKAPHTLTIILAPHRDGTYAIFRFECSLGNVAFTGKSKEEADGYISSLLTKIYQKQPSVSQHPKRICPNCKREMPWNAKICPYCGYDFSGLKKKVKKKSKENMKVCPNCKKEIPIDAIYCPYCGYNFSLNKNNDFDATYYKSQIFKDGIMKNTK